VNKVSAVIAGILLAAIATVPAAQARPPTAQWSPGYQSALEQSRKAYSDAWYSSQPRVQQPTQPRPQQPARPKRNAAPQ